MKISSMKNICCLHEVKNTDIRQFNICLRLTLSVTEDETQVSSIFSDARTARNIKFKNVQRELKKENLITRFGR